MKITAMKQHLTEEVVAIQCDVCKAQYTTEDSLRIQEFIHIDHTGGFDSAIGDGSNVKVDMCDKCFKNMFEEYWTLKKVW